MKFSLRPVLLYALILFAAFVSSMNSGIKNEDNYQTVLKVGDRVQALKILNSDCTDKNIIFKDEILIVDDENESCISVGSETYDRMKFVMKQDLIYLKQLKPLQSQLEFEELKNKLKQNFLEKENLKTQMKELNAKIVFSNIKVPQSPSEGDQFKTTLQNELLKQNNLKTQMNRLSLEIESLNNKDKIIDKEECYDIVSDVIFNAPDYAVVNLKNRRKNRLMNLFANVLPTLTSIFSPLSKSAKISEEDTMSDIKISEEDTMSDTLELSDTSDDDDTISEPLAINLVRHTIKKGSDSLKYMQNERNKNYEWELEEITKPGGLLSAYYLGIHFYNKYVNSNDPPLIYVSPFRRCIQTAIPTAKALNIKIRIEYGLFETFHGFPTEEEIKIFYGGNEEYIDTEYVSKYYQMSDFIEESGSMYQSTKCDAPVGKEREKIRLQKNKQMSEYFKEVQRNEKKDIIVFSHQDEVRQIGHLLVNPEETDVEVIKKKPWGMGTLIPFYKSPFHKISDGVYEEGLTHYKLVENYNLQTNEIEEFQNTFGHKEPDASDYSQKKPYENLEIKNNYMESFDNSFESFKV